MPRFLALLQECVSSWIPRRSFSPLQRRAAQQQRISSASIHAAYTVAPLLPLTFSGSDVMASIAAFAYHALRPRNGNRLECQRNQSVHKLRIRFAPHPRLHASHRCAHHQQQMIYFQRVHNDGVLRGDHIVVIIMREFRMQTVARLAFAALARLSGK